MEEKTANFERQQDSALELLQKASAADDDWEQKAKDTGSKLATEKATVAMAHDRYTTLEAVVQESCQKGIR
jgi:hypothetical protein